MAPLPGNLPEGSIVPFVDPLGGAKFTISYTGGTGNDIVLTQVTDAAPAVDLNGTGGAGNGFTGTWNNTGAVSAALSGGSGATATDTDDSNLASLTATITAGSNANNVLDVTLPGGQGLTKSYNAVTGVLTVTGWASKGTYQDVLRSLTYNNTAGGPAQAASRSMSRPTTRCSTARSRPRSSRSAWVRRTRWPTGRSSTTSRRLTATTPAIDFTSDAEAIATDKTAYLPGAGTAVFANITNFTRGINGIIIDL